MSFSPKAFGRLVRVCIAVMAAGLALPDVARAQATLTVLHTFLGGDDGAAPLAALIQTSDGNFVGTTPFGGGSGGKLGGSGTVFTLTPDGITAILHAFTHSPDPEVPNALILATDGNFWGTSEGGDFNFGTVFKMTPGGTVTVIHSFSGGDDGCSPAAPLVQATDGNLYGTTFGCNFLGGTIFKVTTGGTLTTLGRIQNCCLSALIQATDGNLYGITQLLGSIFRMTLDGTIAFVGDVGQTSRNGIVQARDGALYGTTDFGGAFGLGTIFKMTLDGTVSVLHEFNGLDGSSPAASLIQASDGNFYGSTAEGGAFGWGTVFRMTVDGAFDVLHSFTRGADGAGPLAPLVQAFDGSFYGTTSAVTGDVDCPCGVAFRLTVSNTATGADVTVAPIDTATRSTPATLTFADVTQTGFTSLIIRGSGPTPPAGFTLGTPSIYYDIETTAVFSGGLTVCIDYTGIILSRLPALFHFENGVWVDRTISLDEANHVICAGVTSLSPFAIFSPVVVYAATIQPPLDLDGTSVFTANRRTVPVKFTLAVNGVPTCHLPPASISLFRTSGGTPAAIDPRQFTMPSDAGATFRVAGCQYVYNLSTRSLGPGTYALQLSIDGFLVGTGAFGLK
jgi:uncharacterized repeat protein (TIGR03803 family)